MDVAFHQVAFLLIMNFRSGIKKVQLKKLRPSTFSPDYVHICMWMCIYIYMYHTHIYIHNPFALPIALQSSVWRFHTGNCSQNPSPYPRTVLLIRTSKSPVSQNVRISISDSFLQSSSKDPCLQTYLFL